MKKMKFFDIVVVLLNIVYPIIFGVIIVDILKTDFDWYLLIVSVIMLLGFPISGFFYFREKLKG
jgi:NhaP-type Na+/H+ or K+/H+ antiporter